MKTTIRFAIAFLLFLLPACGDDGDTPIDPIEARIDALFPEDPGFGALDRSTVRHMLEIPPEDDGPFYMVNLIRHREMAEYPDGRETNLTGREADDLYGSLIFPILIDIGAQAVFVANVDVNLVGYDGTQWDQVGIVLYPSRAEFLAMVERPDLREIAVHKRAGVEKTLVLVATQTDFEFPPGFLEVDLSAVPFPPTQDDPPVAITHLYDFHETAQYQDGRETALTGREALGLYEQGRQTQGVIALGVRPGLWLDIEGELFGDGRHWEEFRINNFPSRATFNELTTSDALDEAGIEHRVAALADTYSTLTVPLINAFGYKPPPN